VLALPDLKTETGNTGNTGYTGATDDWKYR